jgi:hypothetical protein
MLFGKVVRNAEVVEHSRFAETPHDAWLAVTVASSKRRTDRDAVPLQHSIITPNNEVTTMYLT